jgi:Putative zincin peptidase
MNAENKRDLSISMIRANIVALFIMVPVAIMQFNLFNILHGVGKMEITLNLFRLLLFLVLLIASIVVHELIHGFTWVVFGKKPFSAVKFAVQWKTLTPYAHLTEPVDVNTYRIGGFMPGFVLGIIPFILSLVFGDGNLLWFSAIQTAVASGDWLVLWIIRNVRSGTQVEDHPFRAGCYVYAT